MDLTELMSLVARAFDELAIPYFITGSCASISYGEPRLTNDIDVVADVAMKDVAELVARFPVGEFYVSEDAVREAIARRGQFNIIHPSSGLKVDVIVSHRSAFDDSRFKRRKIIPISEKGAAAFASPEDVIIKKMEYYKMGGSEKHLRDITGILKVSGDAVDREYISGWSKRLHLEEVWGAILKRVEKP
jgi:hypothetical protein